jgi:hypothetical protein
MFRTHALHFLQKLSWAKALSYSNLNCHGLKPVAIDRGPQWTLVPFLQKCVHPFFII